MTVIFNLSINERDISNLRKKRETLERFHRIADGLINDAGWQTINEFKARMQHEIGVGGELHIGATGAAAENLYAEKSAQHGSTHIWTIYEGTKTKANFFIRRGSVGRPMSDDGSVPIAKIDEWARAKQLNLFDPDDVNGRQVRWTKRKPRPYKRDRDKYERAIAAIAFSIYHKGISLHRKGQIGTKYYNYIAEVADWQKKPWGVKANIPELWRYACRAMMNYIVSGRERYEPEQFVSYTFWRTRRAQIR